MDLPDTNITTTETLVSTRTLPRDSFHLVITGNEQKGARCLLGASAWEAAARVSDNGNFCLEFCSPSSSHLQLPLTPLMSVPELGCWKLHGTLGEDAPATGPRPHPDALT